MNNKRGMRVTRAGLIVLIALTLSSGSAVAQEGWDFIAGGGVYRDNVYPGSSDYYVVPVPIAGATYETGNFSYYISILNGAGVSWFSEETGLSASASVKYGDDTDVSRL